MMVQAWRKVDFGTGTVTFLDDTQKEDMLQVEYPNCFLLDMGWYTILFNLSGDTPELCKEKNRLQFRKSGYSLKVAHNMTICPLFRKAGCLRSRRTKHSSSRCCPLS